MIGTFVTLASTFDVALKVFFSGVALCTVVVAAWAVLTGPFRW